MSEEADTYRHSGKGPRYNNVCVVYSTCALAVISYALAQ